jgi:hypothetical protein
LTPFPDLFGGDGRPDLDQRPIENSSQAGRFPDWRNKNGGPATSRRSFFLDSMRGFLILGSADPPFGDLKAALADRFF